MRAENELSGWQFLALRLAFTQMEIFADHGHDLLHRNGQGASAEDPFAHADKWKYKSNLQRIHRVIPELSGDRVQA